MTPLKEVFMISVTDNLDFDKLKDIYTSGYTRIPVYHNRKDCIVGIVFTKDLILVDPSDEIPVASILPFCSRSLYAAPKGTSLEKLLAEMQASRSHLYFVTEAPGAQVGRRLARVERVLGIVACKCSPRRHPSLCSPQVGRRLARVERVLGIVTMEDLIETLISIEIIDETDLFEDLDGGGTHQHSTISWRKIKQNAERRLEFFEMIQRRDEMLANGPSAQGAGPNFMGGERPTPQEVRALASYLSNNVPFFRPPHWSIPMLRRLLNRSSISTITDEDVERGRYVYVRGVPASFCCLLLHGQLQIRAGNEGFASEIGPWTTLALPALEAPNYTPDFTARVECAARILIISRQEVLTVLGGALPNGLTSPATGLMGAMLGATPSASAMLGATPSGSAMMGATPSGKALLDGSRSGSGRGSCVGTLPSSLALGPSGGSLEGLDSLDMRMNPDPMSARGEAGADSSGSEQLHDAEEM
jgi:metal transporter CNNM